MTATTQTRPPAEPLPAIPVASRWLGSWQIAVSRRAYAPDELRRLYDGKAQGWAAQLARLGAPDAYATVARRALAACAPWPDAQTARAQLRVLDCGIGDGAFAAALAGECAKAHGLDLHGIDVSPRMLAMAHARLAAAHVPAALHLGTADALPYADGAFDVVSSAHMLEHLAAPALALRECHRVLRPGGAVAVLITRRSLAGLFIRLKWRTHGLTPDQAAGWLADAGFIDIARIGLRAHRRVNDLSIALIARKPGDGPHSSAQG